MVNKGDNAAMSNEPTAGRLAHARFSWRHCLAEAASGNRWGVYFMATHRPGLAAVERALAARALAAAAVWRGEVAAAKRPGPGARRDDAVA